MRESWKLKDILMIAVTGVLFGVIFLGATYSGGFLSGILTPLGMALDSNFHIVVDEKRNSVLLT